MLDLGEPALVFLTEIVHRRPRHWIRDVDQLHDLLQMHGPDPLRCAFARGVEMQIFDAYAIRRALQGTLPLAGGVQ